MFLSRALRKILSEKDTKKFPKLREACDAALGAVSISIIILISIIISIIGIVNDVAPLSPFPNSSGAQSEETSDRSGRWPGGGRSVGVKSDG